MALALQHGQKTLTGDTIDLENLIRSSAGSSSGSMNNIENNPSTSHGVILSTMSQIQEDGQQKTRSDFETPVAIAERTSPSTSHGILRTRSPSPEANKKKSRLDFESSTVIPVIPDSLLQLVRNQQMIEAQRLQIPNDSGKLLHKVMDAFLKK